MSISLSDVANYIYPLTLTDQFKRVSTLLSGFVTKADSGCGFMKKFDFLLPTTALII